MDAYEKQANDFLAKTSSTISIEFKRYGKHFVNDKEERDIYTVTLKRGSRSYTFDFGQCTAKSGYWLLLQGRESNKRLMLVDRDKPIQGQLLWAAKNAERSYNPKLDKIRKPEPPTAYDVLACMQKYDVGSYEDFCSEFGYDTDSRTAEKIYRAVVEEYKNLAMLYSDAELEEMAEIV